MPEPSPAAADQPTATGAPSGTEGAAATAGTTNGSSGAGAPDAAALAKELADARVALATEKARADKNAGDVESAKRYVVGLVTQLQAANAKSATPEDEDRATEQFHERFQRNPQEVLDEVLSSRMAPILQDQYGSAATREREAAKAEATRRGWDWSKYEKQVDTFMEGVPLDARAKPGAYLAALKLQMVEHLDEELDRRHQAKLEAEKAAALEGPTGQRTTRSPKGLSDQEKRVAEELGMPHEEYLKHKAALGIE